MAMVPGIASGLGRLPTIADTPARPALDSAAAGDDHPAMTRVARIAVLLALALAGCIVEVSFDPVGTAASAEGSWSIGGAQASAASCAALEITHVRVRFYDGDRTFDHPRLVFPCEAGGFDTRPDRVVASGTWTMQLLAVNNDVPVGVSNVVASGPLEVQDTLDARGHIVLSAVDFVRAADAGP